MQQKIKIVLASIIIALLVIIPSIFISIEYYKLNPFFYDPGDYLFENYNIFQKINQQGYLSLLFETFFYSQDPLRKCVVLLFSPDLMSSPYAHMLSSFISILTFCFSSSFYLYKKTKKLLFSVLIISVIFIFNVLYDPFWGISAYWLDTTACFFLSSSVFYLLIFKESNKIVHIILFATFVALSILSRYIFCVYAFWIVGPLFAYVIILKWRNNKIFKENVLLPILLVTSIILLISGPYLILNFKYQTERYLSVGYALNSPWKDAVYSYFWFLRDVIGLKQIFLYFSIIVSFVLVLIKRLKYLIFETVFSSWLFISSPIFIIFILKAYNAYHTNLIFIPLLITVIIILFSVCRISKTKVLSISIFIISVTIMSFNYTNNIQKIQAKGLNNNKLFYNQLLSKIDMNNSSASFGNAVFPFCKMITLEYFYKSRKQPNIILNDIYDFKDIYYKSNYPKLEIREIIKLKRNELDQYDEILIYADTNEVKNSKYIEKEISLPVAISNIKYISSNKNWLKTHTFNTKEFGKLIIYKKKENYN